MKNLQLLIIAIVIIVVLYPNIAFADISNSVINVNDTQYGITLNATHANVNTISTNLHSYVYNSLDMNITSDKQYNGSLTLTLTKDAVENVFCITKSDVDNYLKSSTFHVAVDNDPENFTTSYTNNKTSLTFDIPQGSQNVTIFNEFVGMAVSPLVYFKEIPQTGTYSSGQDVIFTGTLVDACGRHLGIEKVYFTAQKLNVTKEVTSDVKGKFSINFTIPANMESGNYTSKIEMYQYAVAYPLSGVETLYLNVKTNNTHTVPESPLYQFKVGIPANKVVCADGFVLIIKAEDDSPACVKPDTAQKLIERGWAESITSGISQTSLASNQTVEIVSVQSISSLTNPGGPPIQLTLKNIGVTPITSLKATLVLNNDYDFDFKNVTLSNPLASGDSISETRILIGAGFRTDLTYPITISGITNNTPFTYTENIHMP